MTSDKQNNGYPAKPFTPTLSAAFHRNKKAPLTPKLASPSPGHPATRRLAHPDHPYSTPIKDEITAVPSTFLSTNVTPRSGSHSILTAHRGPGTPRSAEDGAEPGSWGETRAVKESASQNFDCRGIASLASQFILRHGSRLPMFFHASDARSTASSDLDTSRPRPGQAPLQAPAQGRMSPASSFMYANGDQDRQAADDSYFLSTGKRRSGGLPRPTPARSAISPSPRLMKSPRPSDATSPLADDTHSQPSPNPDMSFDNILHRFDSPPSIIPDRPQRPSIGRHTKSISIDSASNISFSQDSLRASPIIVSNNLNDGTTPVMSDPIPTLRPRIFSNGSSVSTNPPMSIPVSPGKSEVGEGALNARTERKILDLEISNSSLLAINRTLEREMRNQKAELRRFRRLSRSGRLSMAPSARSFSGTALSTTSEMEGVSELSSIRSQDDMSDYSDEDSIADEGILSPGSLAEHDAKHRAHDEKRFMVDLARHQELLVDSQKMNQSLKRCLGWTEELIKEGQKALEYSVHVQDIELGGRVLSPEELGEVGESGRALLSPSTEFAAFPPHDTPSDSFFDFDAATLPLPSSPGGTDLIF
ncbi:hypothetical protein N7476_006851 [Penicillium atrosanguineum]|uniref:Uncharacterized protein n=1 Tax=Penicillium atrosanguineum TaxID=1132637 RepID=A0A9W9U2H7_9EURO|nr:hypothetical protein N7476_006851 [Penicillium atrosanguineum]